MQYRERKTEFRKNGMYQNNICIKCANARSNTSHHEKKIKSKTEIKLKNIQKCRNWQNAQKEKIHIELLRAKWYENKKSITESEAAEIANYDVKQWHKENRILKLKNIKSKC